MNTHYQTLKVARDAPPEVIRMAYKVLCQKYHPDKYPGNRESADRITKELNAAYVVLSDPDKKKAYDEFLDGMEAKGGQEKPRESARQDHKPKEEPKQESRHNADDFKEKPHYKPYDSQRQSPQGPPKPKPQPQTENHHPWRRFFARILDYACVWLILYLTIQLFEGMKLLRHETNIAFSNQYTAWTIICFTWMFIEPIIIGLFGNTPRKKLLGLRIVGNSQQYYHMKRAFAVWVRGMGLGLPFVWSITSTLAYIRLKKTGQTSWDKDYGFTVEAEPIGFFRVAVATVILSLCIVVDKEYRYALNTSSVSYKATQAVKPYSGPGIQDNEVAKKTDNLPTDAQTQFNKGLAYAKGDGVTQNYFEAAYWYRMAAEQGLANAQNNLGVFYYEGRGVTKNYVEAAKWFRMAAEQGYAKAQNSLGFHYEQGLGVPKNYDEAAKWYRMAAVQGNAFAQGNLGYLYDYSLGVPQNYAEAEKWYRMAAEQGDASAQNNLGLLYEQGLGIPKNYDEAAKWYRMAAEQGYADAQYNLGLMYGRGEGVTRDYDESVKWFSMASNQGHEKAKAILNRAYSNPQ